MHVSKPEVTVKREIKLLGIISGLRGFGLLMISSFLSLYLLNILKLSYAQVGTLIFLLGLPGVVLSPVAGLISDRLGRKRLLLLCLVGEFIGFFLLAYSMEIKSLMFVSIAALISLFFDFFGGPPNSAYVADITEGSERTKGFTYIRVGYNVGAAVGVGSGGILVGIIGFPVVTLLCSFLIGLSTIIVVFSLPLSPYDRILKGENLISKPNNIVDSSSNPVSANLSKGASSIKHSLQSMTSDMVFLEITIGFALASLVGGQWGVTFQLFGNTKLELAYSIIGFAVAINAIVVVFGQTYITNSVINQHHTTIGIAGLLCYCVAFVAIGISGKYMLIPLWMFLLTTIVATIGENLLSIPLATLPSNLAPRSDIGNYNGAFQSFMSAGWMFSTFIGGLILEYFKDPLIIWIILILPAIPAIVLLIHASGKISEKANRI